MHNKYLQEAAEWCLLTLIYFLIKGERVRTGGVRVNSQLVSVYKTRQILACTPIKNIVHNSLILGLHEINRRRKKKCFVVIENNV